MGVPAVKPKEKTKGKRSGGPRTAMGKRRASLNSVRHGIMSKADVLDWEDQQAFDSHVKVRLDFYEMETEYEREMIRDLARYEWRLRRLDNFENFTAVENAVRAIIDPELHFWNELPKFDYDPQKMLEKFTRLKEIASMLVEKAHEWTDYETNEGLSQIEPVAFRELLQILEELARAAKTMVTLEEYEREDSWYGLIEKTREALFCAGRQVAEGHTPLQDQYTLAPLKVTRVAKAVRQLHRAVFERLTFILKAEPVAREREELTEDWELIAAGVPDARTLKKFRDYRSYLEKCIQRTLARIEVCRAVRDRVKSSNIRKIR